MKIIFIMDRRANRGSIQAVASYVRAGDELGHTIALYGRPDASYPGVRCSTKLGSFDRVVFICEFGLQWISGLRVLNIMSQTSREQRAILDADGMYNPIVSTDHYDRNHTNELDRRRWMERCDQLTDRIFQPTLIPKDSSVLPVPFYGYDPTLRTENGGAHAKAFDIMHMGHNWWRWKEVSEVLLPAFERVRTRLARICFVGLWWDMVPAGAREQNLETAFGYDLGWFQRLGIEIRPPVSYTEVISTMSESRINIMTQRPLFRQLRLLTSKYFELFCANTIPLVRLDPEQAESVYGPEGRELTLHGNVADKLLDVMNHPRKYEEITQAVREYLGVHHSYRKRTQDLVKALKTVPREKRSSRVQDPIRGEIAKDGKERRPGLVQVNRRNESFS